MLGQFKNNCSRFRHRNFVMEVYNWPTLKVDGNYQNQNWLVLFATLEVVESHLSLEVDIGHPMMLVDDIDRQNWTAVYKN